ncbi:cupin [Natrinema pellirubrum DSM 15624]|uniref:Cupin n=1 Tax=Natrinema pellirubrum (strain DSM 15624 / CIP 106293 / JCM 10476 / NCIMB 786 / 157) TaxID=797303 RepID=L0JHF2_NATP1|nr:cupin domain-containing protein [Natrinema pellirubrum]AGB29992.1 mannose-6-phosphate isomerase [Natrinema pellirubrum DSM 15624]ELY70534.1 cupin [Natrinema pellirubrum DSM 15624]
MRYSVVDPGDLERVDERPCDLRRLSDAAGMENVAINRFDAEPGEQLPLAYHSHETQEEVFVVLSGTLHVETPDEEFTVPQGSLFAVEPGAPQRAYNPDDADDSVSVIAVGAPAVDGDAVPYEPEE